MTEKTARYITLSALALEGIAALGVFSADIVSRLSKGWGLNPNTTFLLIVFIGFGIFIVISASCKMLLHFFAVCMTLFAVTCVHVWIAQGGVEHITAVGTVLLLIPLIFYYSVYVINLIKKHKAGDSP